PAIDAYQARLERLEKDMTATFLKYSDTYQTYIKEGEGGLRKKTAQQADKNEMLAQMGGLEKVSKMSEAEAQAAAMAAYQKKMQAPAAAMGPAANANMNGLMQDMLKDPKLRERFEKMSEKEKQTFLQTYTAKEIPRDDAQYEKTMAQQTKLTHFMNHTQALAAIQQEVMDIGSSFNQQAKQLSQMMQQKRDSLKKWYDEAYAKIPMIAEGEGLWKDGKQALPLLDKYNKELDKLAKQETIKNISIWQEYHIKVKPVLARFEDKYISSYKLGVHHDVDQHVASVAGNFIDLMKGMAISAGTLTPRLQE
ncbi:MAG TPA: hypothetical protein VD794_12025, partial [Flavisolibacter sp.]|nr:hypothetical protein [Flavisolibacter sp.]